MNYKIGFLRIYVVFSIIYCLTVIFMFRTDSNFRKEQDAFVASKSEKYLIDNFSKRKGITYDQKYANNLKDNLKAKAKCETTTRSKFKDNDRTLSCFNDLNLFKFSIKPEDACAMIVCGSIGSADPKPVLFDLLDNDEAYAKIGQLKSSFLLKKLAYTFSVALVQILIGLVLFFVILPFGYRYFREGFE